MGTVRFSTIFSGGVGSLTIISNDARVTLQFNQASHQPQPVVLPQGSHIFSINGAAPNGPGGNIELDITGDLPGPIKQNFAAGLVPPHPLIIFVTR
ncbi:MAG TPA: hypothetical protein VMH27_09745 [Puia sp.]|nr:hypothetical protein [Puia sp.]